MTEIEELCRRLSYFESIGIMKLKRGEEMEFSCPECGAKAHAVRIAATGLWVFGVMYVVIYRANIEIIRRLSDEGSWGNILVPREWVQFAESQGA